MSQLPLYESFFTWQGEGTHLGRSAYFIRTMGCPLKCQWCDSAGTWRPDLLPANIELCEPDTLAERAVKSGASIVVVTGGEPAIHDLSELTTALHSRSLPVHLETSGAFELKGDFDWVTVSPKWKELPTKENLALADELKIIVESADSIREWWEVLAGSTQCRDVWLQAEWSMREDECVMQSISNWVKAHGDPFRAGYQIHKLFRVDE